MAAAPLARKARKHSLSWALSVLALGCCTTLVAALPAAGQPTRMENLIPLPSSVNSTGGIFELKRGAKIQVSPATPELRAIAQYLAERLNPATGFGIPVVAGKGAAAKGAISLSTVGGRAALGEEGYELKVTRDHVTLVAHGPAGLFRGVQTLRQLLPPKIEQSQVQEGPFEMPTGVIRDRPRFQWRGLSLDIARCFFGAPEIKRYVDLMAYYKLNRLHLHLSDDQGWRIEIKSWPKLTSVAGGTAMAGGTSGFLTQEEFAGIVAYAQSRYILVVPEIDMPGHTNAALSAYPELNCDGQAPAPYTGDEVGFSSLCLSKEITYKFVDDVIRELAAITPGPYIHIGGDETLKTPEADYSRFVARALAIVKAHGKQPIGWGEVAKTERIAGVIVQHWIPNAPDLAKETVAKGAKLIMSPASKAYLDMKYTAATKLGQDWAGLIEVKDSYDWDPVKFVAGVNESDVLGVEGALWTETIRTRGDIDQMVFPRLSCLAEIAWSPAVGRGWEEFRIRLGAHGARFSGMAVDFHRSPQISW